MKKFFVILCGLLIVLNVADAAPRKSSKHKSEYARTATSESGSETKTTKKKPIKKKSTKPKSEPAADVSAVVNYIFDGDTFSAMVTLQEGIEISVRVRIIDIDAPEMNGECDSEIKLAHRAKDRLAELTPIGSTVQLSKIKDDKYIGRIDAVVKTDTGINVGDVLVSEKLARKYSGKKRMPWCIN